MTRVGPEFYQVGTIRNKDGKEILDHTNLNMSLRRSFESLGEHGQTLTDLDPRVVELESAVKPRLAVHATDWPTIKDCTDRELFVWNNQSSGWRLYLRVDEILLYATLI